MRGTALLVATVLAFAFAADRVEAGSVLDSVKTRGLLVCGVSANVAGFSSSDGQGKWKGLEVDVIELAPRPLGWGALMGGFSKREALQLGVGMMSRGEVGLIVASVGVSNGLIQPDTFSAVVGVVILTTILTPLLLRWLFTSGPKLPVIEQKSPEGA